MNQNYETYEALDFAQDDSFIRWVKGEDDAARQFWEAWRDEHPEKAGELEAARRLVLALRVEEEEPAARQIDDLWNKIDRATQASPQNRAKRIPIRLILQYVAAACIGLLVFLTIFDPHERISTGNRQVLVTLPDGSSVNLNRQSSITFKKRGWTQNRVVQLEGEGFFSVRKGNPFTVNTLKGQVKVLGTSFNVKAGEEAFEVKCLSGRVSVAHGASTQVLSARQSTHLQTDGRLSPPEEELRPDIADWRNVEIIMDSARLQEVFEELERQFGIEVVSNIADDERLVNAFFRNSNLDSALYNIHYAVSNISFEERGDTIIVSDKVE